MASSDPFCPVHGQMLCDCSTSLRPHPINVIDYGQYNSRPMPSVPMTPGAYWFTPHTVRLSDQDVERIARRLAELLKPA